MSRILFVYSIGWGEMCQMVEKIDDREIDDNHKEISPRIPGPLDQESLGQLRPLFACELGLPFFSKRCDCFKQVIRGNDVGADRGHIF